jgi:pseudouridine-5'-monophosphatase
LGAKVICRYDDSAGGRKPFQDVFIAAALERAVGSIDEKSEVVGEEEREERARGLVFEDAILGARLARQRRYTGLECCHCHRRW